MLKTDKIDNQIVELLIQDGRMPAVEIARRVGGITERVVRYRINRLIEQGLISVSAIVHPQKLGYQVSADVVIEAEAGRIQEITQKLMRLDLITYVACSIGETDISVQLVGRDPQEIYQFVTGVIGKMPGVRKTNTTIVPIVLKDVYQWRIPREVIENSDGNKSK